MDIGKLIKKLEKIAKKHGNNVKVIMADNISIADPVFSKKYPDKKNVIITDKNNFK